MPHRCCVPGCRGHYDNGPKVAVFSFPRDTEQRQKWIHCIRRKDDYTITKSSRVCQLHFSEDEILRETHFFDESKGRLISYPIKHPTLKKGAIPTLFPGCPSYLSTPLTSRESPTKKRQRIEGSTMERALRESLKSNDEYEARQKTETLTELKNKLKCETLSPIWSIIESKDNLLLIDTCLLPAPYVKKSILINSEMMLSFFHEKTEIKKISELDFPLKIHNMNTLRCVLTEIENIPENSTTSIAEELLKSVLTSLISLKVHLPEQENTINFLAEQVSKLSDLKNAYRHSTDLLIFSSLLFSISPHSYKFLRNSQNIILPHHNTIKRLCLKCNVNPRNEQFEGNFLTYAKQKFKHLTPSEYFVALLIDEIHLKSMFDFKGGNVVGQAYNSGTPANSAHVFMIQSFLSPFKDVIHILPVRTLNAEDLHFFIKKIVMGLEHIGYRVLCVCTDNNSINRKAMSSFDAPPKLNTVYKHPYDATRPLFYIIDAVHLIKNIRNNWINQRNHGNTMYFPSFENQSTVEAATFSTLKKLHELETGSLLKYSFGMTLKALNPSNIERQSVKLALQIINSHVISGLREIGEKYSLENFQSTSNFIELINTWWSIMNVKTPFKGIYKRDKFQAPLTAVENDERLCFLNKFLAWLEQWKNMKSDTGRLTVETHTALTQTTRATIQLVEYCSKELKFKYLLTSKIQTDSLESRFGRYRQLAGSQYSISVRQVFEVENKIRLQSVLPLMLKSNKYGDFKIEVFGDDVDPSPTQKSFIPLDDPFKSIVINEHDIKNAESWLPLLTYISGYFCHSYIKKTKCISCKNHITLDKSLDVCSAVSYMEKLDRGGLLYPHQDVLTIVLFNFLIMQKLISSEYETNFLRVTNQKEIVLELTKDILLEHEVFMNFDVCNEGHSSDFVLSHILRGSTNTLLKNYSRSKNDFAKPKINKRKLQTLKS